MKLQQVLLLHYLLQTQVSTFNLLKLSTAHVFKACQTHDIYGVISAMCDGQSFCSGLPITIHSMGDPLMEASCHLCSLSASIHYACVGMFPIYHEIT